MSALSAGRGAAAHIFHVIDRKTEIDPMSTEGIVTRASLLISTGITLPSVEGNIEFKDIKFSYPTRPQAKVLRGLNLSIQRYIIILF